MTTTKRRMVFLVGVVAWSVLWILLWVSTVSASR